MLLFSRWCLMLLILVLTVNTDGSTLNGSGVDHVLLKCVGEIIGVAEVEVLGHILSRGGDKKK